MSATRRRSTTGLQRFVDLQQQRDWMQGKTTLRDTDKRAEFPELRFKYVPRFEKLLRRPQAQEVLAILRLYAATCLPLPRTTERTYWSVSSLPATSDKPLARVNASWMELFTLLSDEDHPPRHLPGRGTGEAGGGALRARFILHLSDFTIDGSYEPDHLDQALLEQCVDEPESVSHFFWKGDTFGIKVRSAAAIRAFLAHPHALRAIRRFNLTHMNRGRNAYQASHCYSLADRMLD